MFQSFGKSESLSHRREKINVRRKPLNSHTLMSKFRSESAIVYSFRHERFTLLSLFVFTTITLQFEGNVEIRVSFILYIDLMRKKKVNFARIRNRELVNSSVVFFRKLARWTILWKVTFRLCALIENRKEIRIGYNFSEALVPILFVWKRHWPNATFLLFRLFAMLSIPGSWMKMVCCNPNLITSRKESISNQL